MALEEEIAIQIGVGKVLGISGSLLGPLGLPLLGLGIALELAKSGDRRRCYDED